MQGLVECGSDERVSGDYEQREEMRAAAKALRYVRSLCKDYGTSFSMPESNALSGSVRRSASGDTLSSGSSVQEVRQESSEWSKLQGYLDELKIGHRLNELKQLDKALAESKRRAQEYNEELDAMVDNPQRDAEKATHLLDETDAVRAVRRCAAVVPKLKQRVFRQQEIQLRTKHAKALAERRAREAEDSTEDSEEDQGEESAVREVLQKMHALSTSACTSEALQRVLEVQKAEILSLAGSVDEDDRKLVILLLATGHVDDDVDDNVDSEMMEAAIATANNVKEGMMKEQREVAEAQELEKNGASTFPSEKNVRECEEECRKRQTSNEELNKRLRNMCTAEATEVGPRQVTSCSDLQVDAIAVVPEEAPRLNQELLDKIHVMEGGIRTQKESRAAAEAKIQCAEQTLKSLEDLKLSFLEHIARHGPPKLMQELLSSTRQESPQHVEEDEEEPDELCQVPGEMDLLEGDRLMSELTALEARWCDIEPINGDVVDRVTTCLQRALDKLQMPTVNSEGFRELTGRFSQGLERRSDIASLRRLREGNATLLQDVRNAQQRLRRLRETLAPETRDESELVMRQRQELCSLRNRWWSDRQSPKASVARRAVVARLSVDDPLCFGEVRPFDQISAATKML